MRRMFRETLRASVLAAVVGSIFLTSVAMAQDAASLEAAGMDFYDKLNNEDPSYADYHLPDTYQFPRTGMLLEPNADTASARAVVDAGLNFEVVVHHLNTQIFGSTGIATYYTTGPTTYPDGTIVKGTFRASITAIGQGNQWRWAHLHLSELETEPD